MASGAASDNGMGLMASRSDDMSAALARNWWAIALRGVLAVVFGLISLFVPGAVMLSLALLCAAYLLLDGVFAIIAAVGGSAQPRTVGPAPARGGSRHSHGRRRAPLPAGGSARLRVRDRRMGVADWGAYARLGILPASEPWPLVARTRRHRLNRLGSAACDSPASWGDCPDMVARRLRHHLRDPAADPGYPAPLASHRTLRVRERRRGTGKRGAASMNAMDHRARGPRSAKE